MFADGTEQSDDLTMLSVCREHGIDDETAKTLNLALEEWVANVIGYAYPKGMRGHVEVDIDAELDERAIGGLGIHLVRTIMDTVEYQRTADGYNRLVLTKKLIIEN